jgi:hypothetical protein
MALVTDSTKQTVRYLAAGKRAGWIAVAVGGFVLGFPLGVYLLTLAPTVYSLDSPELATAAHSLGIAHAPGYPLYTLLGWLFSHALPVGDVAYRLNLLSALLAVATIFLVYHIARRLTGQIWAALAGSLMLAFSYFFWADSLMAEVYTLDTLLLAGMILLALNWRERQDARTLFALTLLFGLSLANRTSVALFAPAFVLYLMLCPKPSSKRLWLIAPAFLLFGLILYLYIPLASKAGPAYAFGYRYDLDGTAIPRDFSSIQDLWWLISAKAFHSQVFAYSPTEALGALAQFGWWLTSSFVGIGLLLGGLGIWHQYRSGRRELILLAGVFVPCALFYANYRVADKEFMFLPSYLVWALWIAVGAAALAELAPRYLGSPAARRLAQGFVLLLPLVALTVNYPLVDLSSDYRASDEASNFMASAPPSAIVVGPWIDVAPMLYMQVVEKQRPDLRLVHRWLVDDRELLAMAEHNMGIRSLYVLGDEDALKGLYQLVRTGEKWYLVQPKAEPAPPAQSKASGTSAAQWAISAPGGGWLTDI